MTECCLEQLLDLILTIAHAGNPVPEQTVASHDKWMLTLPQEMYKVKTNKLLSSAHLEHLWHFPTVTQ